MNKRTHIHDSQPTADAWEAAMRYYDMAARVEATGALGRANWYVKIASGLLAEALEPSSPATERIPIASTAGPARGGSKL